MLLGRTLQGASAKAAISSFGVRGPTRLVAGLFILKHMHNLSDEALCERWVENP
jgi:hypothetical protein